MKTGRMLLAAMAFSFVLSGVARSERTDIKTLNGMSFDGTYLQYSYVVESGCRAEAHKASVVVDAAGSSRNTVRKLSVSFVDAADESRCGATTRDVVVKGQVNLRSIVRKAISELEDEGRTVADDYSLILPEVVLSSTTSGVGSLPHDTTPATREPEKVTVVRKSYTPSFTCTLRKNDGSRKDGFTGTGATLEEAQQGSIAGCRRTNNPYCEKYAKDFSHTTCAMTPKANLAVEEYSPDRLPAELSGAKTSWNCLMNNGNAGTQQFVGTGGSETEARTNVQASCSAGGVMNCVNLSTDSDRTSCSEGYLIEGPMPKLVWSCYLRKNDGARRDGFEGTGNTPEEAQAAAAKGCYSTNNPNCTVWSKDPTHTACSMKVIQ